MAKSPGIIKMPECEKQLRGLPWRCGTSLPGPQRRSSAQSCELGWEAKLHHLSKQAKATTKEEPTSLASLTVVLGSGFPGSLLSPVWGSRFRGRLAGRLADETYTVQHARLQLHSPVQDAPHRSVKG